MKLEIYRPDINKVVLQPTEFADVDSAIGKYLSVLMLAGIVRKGTVDRLESSRFQLENGWIIEARSVA